MHIRLNGRPCSLLDVRSRLVSRQKSSSRWADRVYPATRLVAEPWRTEVISDKAGECAELNNLSVPLHESESKESAARSCCWIGCADIAASSRHNFFFPFPPLFASIILTPGQSTPTIDEQAPSFIPLPIDRLLLN